MKQEIPITPIIFKFIFLIVSISLSVGFLYGGFSEHGISLPLKFGLLFIFLYGTYWSIFIYVGIKIINNEIYILKLFKWHHLEKSNIVRIVAFSIANVIHIKEGNPFRKYVLLTPFDKYYYEKRLNYILKEG